MKDITKVLNEISFTVKMLIISLDLENIFVYNPV